MKVLGIESSGIVASVAIVEDSVLLGEYTINHKRTHSRTLMPMLDELKKNIELDLETIDAIAVAAGPGSYTGLRISSSTAKGLGMALDKPVISVPTIDALAYNLWGSSDYVCPIMDARRSQVYTGIYRFDQGSMEIVEPQKVEDINRLLSDLWDLLDDNDYGDVVFIGDAVNLHRELIVDRLEDLARFAPASLNMNRAASVAALGVEYAREGKVESASAHRPYYLKLSQAERERLEEGKDILEPSDGTYRADKI